MLSNQFQVFLIVKIIFWFQMSAKCEWGVQVMSSGGRTMASRVPDSPPDWRLPILTSKFYASKCSSPPNGPQQMFASKCFAWDKCDSSKWLPPSFRLPNVPHQWGHLQMTSYLHNWHLTMVWSSLKLGNWQLAIGISLLHASQRWSGATSVCLVAQSNERPDAIHMGPMGHLKFWPPNAQQWSSQVHKVKCDLVPPLPRGNGAKPLPINDDQIKLICHHLPQFSASESRAKMRFLWWYIPSVP